MELLLYTIIPVVLTSVCAYKFGGIRAIDLLIKEEEHNKWSCPECHLSINSSDVESLVWIWRVHDESTDCPHKWSVTP
jgi:hypothetical protein